jgi:hypothetical protein
MRRKPSMNVFFPFRMSVDNVKKGRQINNEKFHLSIIYQASVIA